MTYTAAAVLAVVVTVVLDVVVLRTRLVTRKAFWVAYAVILFFQLLVNGVLTGRRVVTYADDAVLGARFVYAPVEDLLFGFALVVQSLAWWVWLGRLGVQSERSAPRSRGARRRRERDREPPS